MTLGGHSHCCCIRICPEGTFRLLQFEAGNPEVFKTLRDCRVARESTTLSSRDRFASWQLGWDVASRHVLGDGHLPGWSKGMPRKPCPGCPLFRSSHQKLMGSTEDKAPSLSTLSLSTNPTSWSPTALLCLMARVHHPSETSYSKHSLSCCIIFSFATICNKAHARRHVCHINSSGRSSQFSQHYRKSDGHIANKGVWNVPLLLWPRDSGTWGTPAKPGIKRVNQKEQLIVGSQEHVSWCEVALTWWMTTAEEE